mmetsp:Transcript_5584/g.20325  ORF Transcript_5584/g.20325 Transcript_5584/m.20325 type:complete len:347 (+) Transcript_5584:341-1381(+)
MQTGHVLPGDLPGYQFVKDIGAGNFGIARLLKSDATGELVAVKFIERGPMVDENVRREVINQMLLQHPNVVQFKELQLTNTHVAIVMEYASGGELFHRVVTAGRFVEDEARFFFQQLVSGVNYCHDMEICHRDLKLENTLLTNDAAPRVKICDFGYSKNGLLDSQPKTTVGTPAYIAPEVLQKKKYDGKLADVWSCGVTLYVMLVGAYPFEAPHDPRNFRETIRRIMNVEYSLPPEIQVSDECKDLLNRIFQYHPENRITLPQVMNHPWFLVNLPMDLVNTKGYQVAPRQSMEEINSLLDEARELPPKPVETAPVATTASSFPLDDMTQLEETTITRDIMMEDEVF